MTFPASPVVTSSENSTMALCFTEDFSPICVQYQPVGLVLEATEQEVAETMASVARTMISGYGASIIANSQLSGSADTLWRIDFSTQVDMGFGEPFANTWLCSALVGEAGIWYISAGDTAQGRQFMASIGTQAVAEPVVSSGLMIEAAALMAQPRAQDASPATVYQFAGDLYALLKEQTYGCTLGTDYLEVSGAIFMDGRWVRVVSTGYADIFALLYLAASEEDAAINEVRVLGIEGCDLQTYRTFAACCVLAAEGPEAKKELAAFAEDLQATLPSQRYKSHCAPVASEFTTLSYQRLTMVAHEPAQSHPLFSLEEDEELPLYYLEPRMTVSQFYTEWETVNQTLYQGLYPLQKLSTQPMDEETFIHYSAASENTFVALTALGSGDDALIISVDVYNTANSAPPEALLCGLMSFAAATQIPQDQFAALLLALTEYPLWADLCSMRPLAVWNDAMLVVFTGQMSDGTATASAILSGIPQ